MIVRRIFAAVALLCAITSAHAQTGSPKSATQLNTEINTLFADQVTGQITPFDVRQVALDQVASSVLGTIVLTGPITGSGINTIATTIGSSVVHSSSLNADVFSTANTWPGLQTFSGGVTGLPSPVNPSDAVTLAYAQSLATGIVVLAPSRLATAAILPNTPTYANGTAGVGATLTAGGNSTLTVDGTVANINDVVLVKNQASAFQNGIYTVTTAGSGSAAWVLTRATYFNTAAQMTAGSYTFISAGSANINSSWTLATTVVTVGSSAVNWNLFSVTGSGVTSIGSGVFTGAVTNAQVTSSCNAFTSSLSGCTPSSSGTTTISQLQPGATWAVPTAYVASSRTVAAALNLTGVNVVQTLGYATAGDGGGATFKNVGAAVFQDQNITGANIVAGSGYTNGVYLGVPLGGGSGVNCSAQVTVSGGGVTGVLIGVPCMGYTVGNVLTAVNSFIGGTGSGFTYTVTSTSTPLASFTDAASNHWQYTVDQGNVSNIRQFGAVLNWTLSGGDGAATNDQPSIQAALNFAGINNGTGVTGGGIDGNVVNSTKGASLICGGLVLPDGVIFSGVSPSGSLWKQCSAEATGTNFITLCDPTAKSGQFPCRVQNAQIFSTASATTSSYEIYSNSGQQFPLVDGLEIVSQRGCIHYEIGKGGAANAIFSNIDCEITQSSVAVNGIFFNSSNTQAVLTNIVFGCGSSTCPGIAINVTAGASIIQNLNVEAWTTGVSYALTTTDLQSVKNVTASGCTQVISLVFGNPSGNAIFENVQPGSCTRTVTDGQSGGSNFSGNIVLPKIFNP